MKKLNITAIQSKMEELGLLQANLASKLGVSRKSVSQWLKGAKMPRPATVLKLATLLQMSFSVIVLREKEAIGSFAYRTRRKAVTDSRAEKATIAMQNLHCIFKDREPLSPLAMPNLENPTLQHIYIQKAANSIRKMMHLEQKQVITPKAHHRFYASLPHSVHSCAVGREVISHWSFHSFAEATFDLIICQC